MAEFIKNKKQNKKRTKIENGVVVYKPDPNRKIKDNILDLIEEGMWQRDSAILAGINERTFYRWLIDDVSFASQVERAILKYKQKLIKVVNIGSIQKPDIAVRVLEKRWPEEWDKPKKIEVVDPDKQLSETLSKLMGTPITNKEELTKDSDEPNTTESTSSVPGVDPKKST